MMLLYRRGNRPKRLHGLPKPPQLGRDRSHPSLGQRGPRNAVLMFTPRLDSSECPTRPRTIAYFAVYLRARMTTPLILTDL